MLILKNRNYRNFLIGRFSSNIGDSLTFQLIPLFILSIDKSEFWLSVNGFLLYLPYFIFPMIAIFFDKVFNKKHLLIFFEIINLILVITLIGLFIAKKDIILILSVMGLYYLSITFIGGIQNSFFKSLVKEEDLTEFFRAYELTGSISDTILDAIATLFIQITGFITPLILNVVTFMTSIFSFNKIEYVPKVEKEVEIKRMHLKELRRNKVFFTIVCIDSILNGFVTMLIIIMPLYLAEKGMIIYYPLIIFSRSLSGVCGLYFSKYIEQYNYNLMYGISYVVYAIMILFFIRTDNIFIMIISYFIAFLPNTSLIPFYSKILIQTYEEKEITQITSYTQLLLVIGILIVISVSAVTGTSSMMHFYMAILIAIIMAGIQVIFYLVNRK